MAALDRKRPFGVISGDDEGRFFEQDGVFFAANGSAWQPMPDPDAPAAPAATKPAAARKAKPADEPVSAVDAQLDAQLGAA